MSGSLDQLIEMSHQLGDPALDFVILGEGNTSTRADAGTFWVKGSGTQLIQAEPGSFVRVKFEPILAALNRHSMNDKEVGDLLKSSTVEGTRTPSIETFLHAQCLELPGVHFVGHTHPTVAVGLLSCLKSRELFAGPLFPDQIVLTGASCVYVPYTDPGLPLAKCVQRELRQYMHLHHRVPRVLLMENHGVIALGATAQEVLNITSMLVKSCRALAITLAGGGPRFLAPDQIDRIDKRPDELARRADMK